MLSFKYTPIISEEDEEEEEEEDDDEDHSLLAKNSTTRENDKARRTRKLFATIVANPNMSLPNIRRTKPRPQPSRNYIRRNLLKAT